jgi:hypothetical protein
MHFHPLTMRSEIAVVGHMDKGILIGATGKWLIHPMEDMPVKALYAVVFALSSLGTPAQALDASTAYCVDDFFGGIPVQIVATEPTIEKLGEAIDEAHTITESKDAANVPVGAIEPSDETRSVEYATGNGDRPTVDAATEQSTIPAQIVATEPTIEMLGEAVDEARGVTSAGSKDAANVPVGAIEPSDETRSVEYATGSGDKPKVDAATEQSTIPAQIVATEPTIEMLGEVVEGADGVDITGPNGAADVRVGATLPNDKTQTWRESKPMVDATTEQKLGEAVGRAERVN